MQLFVPAITTRLKLTAPWEASIPSTQNYDLLAKCGLRYGAIETKDILHSRRTINDRYGNREVDVYYREVKTPNLDNDIAIALQMRLDIDPNMCEEKNYRSIVIYNKFDIRATFQAGTVFNVSSYNIKKNGLPPTITFIIQNSDIKELTTRTHGGTSSSNVKIVIPLTSVNEMFCEVVS